MRYLLRSLLGVAVAWSLAMILIFVAAQVTQAWPSRLELPWSDMADFVVTPGGTVAVYSAFFERILFYELDGRFVGSQRGVQARGEHALAVGSQGHLYLTVPPVLCVFEMANGLGAEPICRGGPTGTLGWRLGERGVEPIVGERPAPPPDHPVRVGETLFSYTEGGLSPRRRFEVGDAEVVRQGDCLVVRTIEGVEPRRLCSPWYLWWAKFPVPGAFAWLLLLVLGAFAGRRFRRDRAGPA